MMELRQIVTTHGHEHWYYDGRQKRRPGDLCADGVFAMVRYDWWERLPQWRAYAAYQRIAPNGCEWAEEDKLNQVCATRSEALRLVRAWLAARQAVAA